MSGRRGDEIYPEDFIKDSFFSNNRFSIGQNKVDKFLRVQEMAKLNIVEKHEPREYSAIMHNGGVVLCDKSEGAFLVLRCTSDIYRLKELLDKITTIETE